MKQGWKVRGMCQAAKVQNKQSLTIRNLGIIIQLRLGGFALPQVSSNTMVSLQV